MPAPRVRVRRWAVGLTAAVMLACGSASRGATIGFWNGGSGQWTDPANWALGNLPNGIDDAAIFATAGVNTITVGAPVTVGSMTFDLGTFTVSGTGSGAVTFSSASSQASLVVTGGVSGATTLTLPVTLASNLVVTNNATSALVFTGMWSGGGNLTLNGRGEVDLRGTASSWTPAVITVNQGLLSTVSGSMFSLGDPTSGMVVVANGASLDVTGIVAANSSQQFVRSLVLSGAGTTASPGAVSFGATNSTLLGAVVLNGATTFNGKSGTAVLHIGDPLAVVGGATLSGNGPLIKGGSGTLQVNVAATYTGGTQVNGGSLTIGAFGSLVGTGDVTLNNGGRLILRAPAGSSTSNSVSLNSVILNGGLLSVAADISVSGMVSPSSTSGILSIETGTTFTAGGTNIIDLSSLPANSLLSLGATSGTTLPAGMTLIPDASHTFHFTAFSGGFTLGAAVNDVGGVPTNVGFAVGSGQIVLSGNSNYSGQTIINGPVSVNVTSVNGLGSPAGGTTINAGGILTAGAAIPEPLTVNGGTVHITSATSGAILIKSGLMDITSAGGTSAITLTGGSLTLAAVWTQPIVQNGGVLLVQAGDSGNVSISGGTMTISSASGGAIQVNGGIVNMNATTNQAVTILGGTVNLSNAASGSFLVSGGALRQLTGASFGGPIVTLTGGRLSLTGNLSFAAILNAASTGGALTIDVPGSYNQSIDFSVLPGGSSLTLGSTISSALSGSGGVILKPDDTTHTLRFGGAGNTGSLTINPVIADYNATPTNINVGQGFTIILPTANTYTGVTTINGNVTVNNALGLGTGSGTDADGTVVNTGGRLITGAGITLVNEKITLNGGSLSLNSAGSVVVTASSFLSGNYSGPISGGGNITISGNTTLSGSSSFTGGVTILSGANATVSSPTGLGDVSGGTMLNSGASLTVSSASAEPVTLAGGTFTVTGPYAGPATVNGGAMNVNALMTGSITINGGTVNLNRAGSGGIFMAGGLLLLNDSVNTHSGPIVISNGTMQSVAPGVAHVGSLTIAGIASVVPGSGGFPSLQINNLNGTGSLTIFPASTSSNIQMSAGNLNFAGVFNQQSNAQFGNVSTSGLITTNGDSSATKINLGFQHTGNIYLHYGTFTLNGPSQVSGNVDVIVGTFAVNADTSIGHLVLQQGSTLSGAGGALTLVDHQLEFHGGNLEFVGTMPGLTQIDKTSPSPAWVSGLPTGFAGPLNVRQGTLKLTSAFAGSGSPINVAVTGASLEIYAPTVSNPINLNSIPGEPGTFAPAAQLAYFDSGSVTLMGAVDLGAGASVSGIFAIKGALTGGSLALRGTLYLDSSAAYTGPTMLYGRMTVESSGVVGATTSITIMPGASLFLDNSVTNVANRIPDSVPIIMNSGWVELDAPGGPNVTTAETIGTVTAASGLNSLSVPGSALGVNNTVQLTVSSLLRNQGAVVEFRDGSLVQELGTTVDGAHIRIADQAQTNFLGGGYVYHRGLASFLSDFVAYDVVNGVIPLMNSDYFVGPETAWTSGTIAGIPNNSTVTLTGPRVIQALKVGVLVGSPGQVGLDLSSNTLNVVSGGVITSGSIGGGTSSHFTAGGTAASAELFIYQGGGSTPTISANITDNPGPDGLYDPAAGGPLDADNGHVSVVLSGAFAFSGTNTYSGTTYVNSSSLIVNSSSSIGHGALLVCGGSVTFNGNFTVTIDTLTMSKNLNHSNSIVGPGKVNASAYYVEEGALTAPLAGNGPLVKASDGTVNLSNIANYGGTIAVLGGSLTLPIATIPNALNIQNATVSVSSGTVLTGSITMGDNSTLYNRLGSITFLPASLTVGTNALIFNDGSMSVPGPLDPFTDSGNPSRHLSYLNAGSISFGPGIFGINVISGESFGIPAGTTIIVENAQIKGIGVTGAFRLRANSAGAASTVGTLTLAGTSNAWTGMVDIANRTLIIQNANNKPAALSQAMNQVRMGFHGGDWLGTGITSSSAAADPSHLAVAVIDNAQLQLTDIGGNPVDDISVIIALTLPGDSNLDFAVTFADFLALQNHYNQAGTDWEGGDWNYDGATTFSDFLIMQNNYNKVLATGPIVGASGSAGGVPEPAGIGVLGCGMVMLMKRRKRG